MKTVNKSAPQIQPRPSSRRPHRTTGAADSFSTGEASRITGVAFRTCDYWAKNGIVKPSIAEADGTGSDRRYSLVDLYALRALAGISVPAQVQRKIVAAVRRYAASGVRPARGIELSDVAAIVPDLWKIRLQVNERVDAGIRATLKAGAAR